MEFKKMISNKFPIWFFGALSHLIIRATDLTTWIPFLAFSLRIAFFIFLGYHRIKGIMVTAIVILLTKRDTGKIQNLNGHQENCPF